MKFSDALPTVLIGAAVVVMQPQLSMALSPKQVSDIARQFTVRIDGIGIGSGIIFERKGDTYFVLTNHHVVEEPGRYEIIAPDGDRHLVYYSQELPNLDLAILQFTSKKNYGVAKFGNSDKLTEGMTVYAVGWAKIPGSDQPSYQFTKGYIRSRLQNSDQGYALGYDNEAIPGMSGGPILDENSLLVGINGRAMEPDISTRTVLRLGIPVNTFVAAKSKLGTLTTIPQPTVTEQPTIRTTESGKQRSTEGLLSSGGGKAQQGDYQGAIAAYEEALRKNPNHPDAYFQRAIAYYDLENYQAAYEDLSQVVRLTPKSSIAYMNRGLTLDLLQRNQEAMKDYTQAISLNPDYAAAYLNRGALKNELGDYQKGLDDLNQAISLKPDYTLAYINRGDSYIGLQDYKRAIADLDEAIRLQPNSVLAYSRRGFAYRQLKEYKKAVLDYNMAIGIQPDDASAHFARAFVLRRLQDNKGAIADYSKIISLNPEFAEAYYNRGLIYQELGDNQKALLDYQKAADLYQQQSKTQYYQDTMQRIRELQSKKSG
ncbi:MAG: tetratricopeptide repeat protein [Goleter apudmare HA4340-LM2]|jgi:tetratricopeptide (TPR) repeat protein|nr:tetratricopeptide repeat protein [Goleter apudmare HA4340-LM2]